MQVFEVMSNAGLIEIEGDGHRFSSDGRTLMIESGGKVIAGVRDFIYWRQIQANDQEPVRPEDSESSKISPRVVRMSRSSSRYAVDALLRAGYSVELVE